MKNAMKKLTSLLLVAVLLVGAIPFGAFAAEFDPTAFLGTSSDVAEAAAEPAPVAEPAPASEEGSLSSNTPVANADVTVNKVELQVYVDYSDKADVNKTITVNAGTSAGLALKEVVGADGLTDIQNNYTYSFANEKNEAVTEVASGMKQLFVTCTRKAVVANEYYIDIDVVGSEQGTRLVKKDGEILTLNEKLLTDNGMSVPAGKQISHFFVNNTKMNKGNTYTVVGGTKIEVITIPADGTATTPDNGTTGGNQGTTGGNTGNMNNNTNTGNQNVQPGSVKVTFYNYAGQIIADPAYADTNGKLSTVYVDYVSLLAKRDGYKFLGWRLNNNSDPYTANQIIASLSFTSNTVFYPAYEEIKVQSTTINSAKNQNDIFLNIFVNKDFQHCKTIKLNDHWVISDDKITKDEILQYVVTDYYKASNGNLGLQADKLYYSVGSFMYNWLTDNGTTVIDNITTKRSQGTVTVNIMVTNAVAKNGAAADKSNPKTGDEIYTAMTVMGLSAASLAAVMFFYNKKRYTV